MSRILARGAKLAIALFALLPIGCVVAPDGGGYAAPGYVAPGYDIGAGYYAPFAGDYGGWGSGYRVGPYADFSHRGGFRPGRAVGAQRGGGQRVIPSIPGGQRGGIGGRQGGGRPGGGGRGGGGRR